MPTGRKDVVAALAVHEPQVLRAIAEAADVRLRGAESSRELAERICDAIWWCYSTPAGYLTERASLEDIVDHVAALLKIELTSSGDAWTRLREMTVELHRLNAARIDVSDPAHGVSYDDLDDHVRSRLEPGWYGVAAAASGGAASLGAGIAGTWVVRLARTPIGRLIPLIPTIGPIFRGATAVAGVVSWVGTPLAIGLSVVALNESLGANYKKLVPLLLGVGALGPTAVSDADELRS
jgi:hypothetical protein